MTGSFSKHSIIKRFFKVLKVIFLEKIPMNILLLIIIISLSVIGFNCLKADKTPTGNVVLEQECPECICEEKECEPDCNLCPLKTKVETQNTIYYTCPGGALVEDLSECKKYLPNVSGEYSGTVEGITLTIDGIKFEKESDTTGAVTRIDYTIINRGKKPIVPKIEVKVYGEWGRKILGAEPNKILEPEIVVNPNDYVKRQDAVRLSFEGKKQTLRLRLINTLPKPDKEILILTRDFNLDDAE